MPQTSESQTIAKTACCMCPDGCGVNLTVEDGKIVAVEGMPEHPITNGFICIKGRQIPDYVYSDSRLKYPMKKEDGRWLRISWDEALDTIARKLKDDRQRFGPTSLALFAGDSVDQSLRMGHDMIWRFGDAYECPNLCYVHQFCAGPRYRAQLVTFGRMAGPDIADSKCILLWAQNTHECWPSRLQHFQSAMKNGAKLIAIDPKTTPFARRADIHIKPRPGTDGALALAMINTIVSEKLYDREFVDNWTVGFDKLKEHIKSYPPEWAEPVTGVPAHQIRDVARMYAGTKPAAIQYGAKIEQTACGTQTIRSIAILMALTGNVDKRGGNVSGSSGIKERPYRIPQGSGIQKLTGSDRYPLLHQAGSTFMGDGSMVDFAGMVLEGNPHQLRSIIISGANPMATWPNTNRVRQALDKVGFLVVMDVFMTATAEMADIVLPACTFVERVSLCKVYENRGAAMLRRKVIEPLWESWSDARFYMQLAKRMGYAEYFPWNTDEECLDYYLEPSGLTVKYLSEEHPTGVVIGRKHYDEYKEKGFPTPSGKVEIYSAELEKLGYDPLPTYTEPRESPISAPELAKEYPLILTAGARDVEYWHSQYHHLPKLRRRNPGPKADINTGTASRYGVADGDTISIETKRGSIEVKARVTGDILPGVVSIGHAWPNASENVLTDDTPVDPLSGFAAFSGVLCRIRKKS